MVQEILKTPDIKDEKNLQFGFHDLDDENNCSEKVKIIKILKELNIDEISQDLLTYSIHLKKLHR